jgi:hypothetical protein
MLAQLDAGTAHERELTLTALAVIERTLFSASVDVIMDAEMFGDIWGDASVEFMGVTLAAIHLKAFARFVVCGSLNNGIMEAKGTIGFEVSVTILCVTYKAHASLDITLIDGSCPLMLEDQTVISQGDLALLLPADAAVLRHDIVERERVKPRGAHKRGRKKRLVKRARPRRR